GHERVAAIEKLGSRAVYLPVEAASRPSVEQLLADVVRDHGPVDMLINCAGVNVASSYFEVTDDEWDHVIGVNLNSVHLGCQIFGRHMVESGRGGSILNIGSVTAHLPLSRVFA